GNFTTNSTYHKNLDFVLSTLPTTNTGLGFFNYSAGQGRDRINSAALCRGDIEPRLCRSCLNDSVVRLREMCPYQKGAVGYYDECWLSYSNKTVLGDTRGGLILYNSQNASDRDRFFGALRPLLNELQRDAAAGGSLRKFASGNTSGPDSITIYGLVQCTPDLSGSQCTDCLETEINNYLVSVVGSIGGRILQRACNFRYEIYRFFNGSTLVTQPPSPPPPPRITQGTPPVPSTTQEGKSSNKTRIIVVVIVTVSVIIITASICIFLRLKKKNTEEMTHSIDNERAPFTK
ncbi:hypothetical protein M8C21_023468, partial [Ambrosia artemisiifolia]